MSLEERVSKLESQLYGKTDSTPKKETNVPTDFSSVDWSESEWPPSTDKNETLEDAENIFTVDGCNLWVRFGLGRNNNYIEVWNSNDLMYTEGFHRNTHNLRLADVTGWLSPLPNYGAFIAVRYGRNRDLFQFEQFDVDANGNCSRGVRHWDRYHRGSFLKLAWGERTPAP